MTKSSKTPEETVQFPQSYDIPGLPGRRDRHMVRLLGTGLCASLFLNVALAMALTTLIPLKTVTPYVLRLTTDERVLATLEPLRQAIGSEEALITLLLDQYVVYRHELVRSDAIMRQRWGANGQVFFMSTIPEYKRFASQLVEVLADLRKNDATTEVQIERTIPLRAYSFAAPNTTGIYQVDFRLIQRNAQNAVVSNDSFTATLEISFGPIDNMPLNLTMMNPTGFKVINYTLAQRAGNGPNGATPAPGTLQ